MRRTETGVTFTVKEESQEGLGVRVRKGITSHVVELGVGTLLTGFLVYGWSCPRGPPSRPDPWGSRVHPVRGPPSRKDPVPRRTRFHVSTSAVKTEVESGRTGPRPPPCTGVRAGRTPTILGRRRGGSRYGWSSGSPPTPDTRRAGPVRRHAHGLDAPPGPGASTTTIGLRHRGFRSEGRPG